MLVLDDQGFPVLDGKLLDLQPKERAVLALLVRRAPQVVSKQAFADEAWAPVPMSDESLARCISRLRRELPELRIESVYGTGYRLAANLPRHSRLLSAAQAPPAVAEAYLHARNLAQQRTPVALGKAIGVLRRLVDDQPHYASARVALAEALAGAASWGLASGSVGEGLAQLAAAERSDPDCPGLAAARAWLLDLAWRFGEAELAHMDALLVASDDPDTLLLYGRHLMITGEHTMAVEQLRAALRLQPYSPLIRATLARALASAGDFDGALAEIDAACREHPDSLIAASYRIGLRALRDPRPALVAEAERLAERVDAPPFTLAVLSYTLARCGHCDEARELVAACGACSASTACSAVLHAPALAESGDADAAAAFVVAAHQEHCALLPLVLRDPGNAALLAHPAVAPVFAAVFS